MRYRVEFRRYQRQFYQPLITAHGVWRDRHGIILRLSDTTGEVGYGEIAPLDWFGTETLEQAWAFCQACSGELEAEDPDPTAGLAIPSTLPACRFGFESAIAQLQAHHLDDRPLTHLTYSALLPTGEAALQAWQPLWQQGVRTFKWKIGVAAVQAELLGLAQLLQQLPQTAKLRLDANGGLNWDTACQWMALCTEYPQVEFLEQPLPAAELDAMLKLSDRYPTPLALDESVATLPQLEQCYQRGWRGIFVVKAAIAGSPTRLQQFCQRPHVDVVWSSVFETAIARRYIERCLIPSVLPWMSHQRPLGFGTRHWFTDTSLDQADPEQLWQTL